MIIQSARIEELPAVLFLSSKYYCQKYMSGKWYTHEEYKDILYIEHRRNRFDLPDYIHKNRLQNYYDKLDNEAPISEVLLESFKKLSDCYIEFIENKPYIKRQRFELWQNLIALTNPLLVLSYAVYEEYKGHRSYLPILKNIFDCSTLPTTYNTFIDNIFTNEGASELHMHFNGTTESTFVWLDALKDPYSYQSDLNKSQQISEVRELYKQFDLHFDSTDLVDILNKAKNVREYLIALVCYKMPDEKNSTVHTWSKYLQKQSMKSVPYSVPLVYQLHPCELQTKEKNELANEAYFFLSMFQYLQDSRLSELHAKLFHFYILAQSIFQQLLIQQQHQYGFDQFQKITMNEIREPIERMYFKRFQQLETLYKKPLEYLEVRFAPKATYDKNYNLVSQILDDYQKYIKDKKTNPELVLVAHFIKRKDQREEKNNFKDNMECIIPYRHYDLRSDLKKQANAFLQLIKNYPKCRQYIKGLDAAANELHASPEVFAPIFRYIKRHYSDAILHEFNIIESDLLSSQSMNLYMTYHAGEDFIHILSGIRMVYEAVIFLDMPPKSRIGHATALGLAPKRWRERIGFRLEIKQGEWLDNLILFYSFLSKNHQLISLANQVKAQIHYYYYLLYNDEAPNDNILLLAYHMRKLDPEILLGYKQKHHSLSPLDAIEYEWNKLLDGLISPKILQEKAIKELEKYHSPKYYTQYNTLVIVDLNEEWDNGLFFFQQELIKILNNKEIAIETMPSSNVRISYYEHYHEHHIFNWFHPKENINSQTETPYLVLASDDPGIFANNLRSEFVHLYEAALENGATIQETEKWLMSLNNNAKRFRF